MQPVRPGKQAAPPSITTIKEGHMYCAPEAKVHEQKNIMIRIFPMKQTTPTIPSHPVHDKRNQPKKKII
jgi:hypothetical protein